MLDNVIAVLTLVLVMLVITKRLELSLGIFLPATAVLGAYGLSHMCSYEIRETIWRGARRHRGRRGFRGQSEQGGNTSSHGSSAAGEAVN
jgi:hypothetical protein